MGGRNSEARHDRLRLQLGGSSRIIRMRREFSISFGAEMLKFGKKIRAILTNRCHFSPKFTPS